VLGSVSLGIGVTELEPVVKRMTKFRDENGLYRETLEEKKGESYRTFYMLETIVLTAGKVKSSKGIKNTLERGLNLLPGVAADYQTSVDATLFGALAKASPSPLDLADSQLSAISQKLLQLIHTPLILTSYKALTSLQTIAGYPNAPPSIAFSHSIIKPGEPVVLEVRGLLGQPLGDVTATIERLVVPVRNEEKEDYRDTALSPAGTHLKGQ